MYHRCLTPSHLSFLWDEKLYKDSIFNLCARYLQEIKKYQAVKEGSLLRISEL
jgi:hypothetical protein